jgi:hypothetical protein
MNLNCKENIQEETVCIPVQNRWEEGSGKKSANESHCQRNEN